MTNKPTNALDTTTSHEIIALLNELNLNGILSTIVTLDPTVAAQTKRIINMQDVVIAEAVKIGR